MSERDDILKRKEPRNTSIRGSLGTRAAWYWGLKNKSFDTERPLTESEFTTIVNTLNAILRKDLLYKGRVVLPCHLGKIDVIKFFHGFKPVNGKMRPTYYIDWNATLNLWCEDPEAKKAKILVRHTQKEGFRICYRKSTAAYKNKKYFRFYPSRSLKDELKKLIRTTNYDALTIE